MEKGRVTSIQMTLLRFVGHPCSDAPVPPLSLFPYQLVYPAVQRSGVIEKSGFKVDTGFRGSARWVQLPLVCWQKWKGSVSDRVISQPLYW